MDGSKVRRSDKKKEKKLVPHLVNSFCRRGNIKNRFPLNRVIPSSTNTRIFSRSHRTFEASPPLKGKKNS